MVTATATARPSVRSSRLDGSCTGSKKKTRATYSQEEIDDLLRGTVRFPDLSAGIASASTAAMAAAHDAYKSVMDGLAIVAGKVWAFMGQVYDTVLAYASAVIKWLDSARERASTAAKAAYQYVQDLVNSMSIDWISIHSTAINLMVTAASIGVAAAVGMATGVVAMGTVAMLVGPGVISMAVGILFTAITAQCVAPVAYTLFKAGMLQRDIAAALAEAEAEYARRSASNAQNATGGDFTVNAVAVMPV